MHIFDCFSYEMASLTNDYNGKSMQDISNTVDHAVLLHAFALLPHLKKYFLINIVKIQC